MNEIVPSKLLEQAVAGGASAALAAALAFAAASGGAGVLASACAALIGLAVASAVQARVAGGEAAYRLPAFELRAFADPGERVPAEDSRAGPARPELLLDDVLERIGPQSRVLRLFEPGPLPTAGEMQARIDRHLRLRDHVSAPPDASQALNGALDELRRSLR